MRKTLPSARLGLALLAGGFIACQRGEVTEWRGEHCRVTEASTGVITTGDDWVAVWNKIGETPPITNLTDNFAVAVFLGNQSSGGFDVEFLESYKDETTLHVRFRKLAPKGIAMQTFTQPYAVKLFPRTDLKIQIDPPLE